ncbi:hypothetical protein NLJ89_g3360 [Agrocybe chaxingu]|uniref:Uncharacterized protein n=1 Tax=Agrocybe chaxingu TaxID=84603 RepID=A0A9W8K515_9AGAR|nr:hypothetical protein NLJ89_g3360 [Agrocybe chaxingu]
MFFHHANERPRAFVSFETGFVKNVKPEVGSIGDTTISTLRIKFDRPEGTTVSEDRKASNLTRSVQRMDTQSIGPYGSKGNNAATVEDYKVGHCPKPESKKVLTSRSKDRPDRTTTSAV